MAPLHLPPLLLLLLLLLTLAASDDVKCLQGLKQSLLDPQGRLSSWDFNTISAGSICKFAGVTCWNDHENRLYKLQLPQFSLSGTFPDSLRFCSSNLEFVDFSGNSFSGSINSSICRWLPYIVSLDFSNNLLTGQIPANLSDCQYLNKLNLSNNRLTGDIPFQLASLTRLNSFSVANNRLNGPIPSGLSHFVKSSFAGNGRLCGRPAGRCGALSRKNLLLIIAAGIFGAVASFLLGLGFWFWYFSKALDKRRRIINGYGIGSSDDDSTLSSKLRPHRLAQVTLFQKPLVKLKLADILSATNNFSHDSIMLSTETGTTYKAVLPDGSALAVKHLNRSAMNEKQFRGEIIRLGSLRHPNLVSLLGFCVVQDERLLVYKHMCNGTLFSLLHDGEVLIPLDWPARFQICLSLARGLAWLHHGNNPPWLHQSLSSKVVLLDEDLDARLIDFGLARLNPRKDNLKGEREREGDVYAFGVVLLEVVTRRKPDVELVDWVKRVLVCGRVGEVIDREVFGKGYDDDIVRVLEIACKCVADEPKERLSMHEAYESLNRMSDDHEIEEAYDDFPLIRFGNENQ